MVLAGPTAVGKGTVSAWIREHCPDVWLSVSVTTRPPRPGEVDGVHYRFVDDATFDRMVAAGDLLEWAVVHGAFRYGTPRGPVEEVLDAGRPALLEIDLQGARLVREAKAHVVDGASVVIVAQYQRMSHYGLAGFGTAAAYAKALDRTADEQVLKSVVSDIYRGDEIASRLAERLEAGVGISSPR